MNLNFTTAPSFANNNVNFKANVLYANDSASDCYHENNIGGLVERLEDMKNAVLKCDTFIKKADIDTSFTCEDTVIITPTFGKSGEDYVQLEYVSDYLDEDNTYDVRIRDGEIDDEVGEDIVDWLESKEDMHYCNLDVMG